MLFIGILNKLYNYITFIHFIRFIRFIQLRYISNSYKIGILTVVANLTCST